MSDDASGDPGSPGEWLRDLLVGGWRDLKSVYYANTPIWRLLKSGTLLFFGFFLWTGANLLLSYQQGWTVLYYVMAYGFALLLWGPLTHLVVVPLVIRLRRGGSESTVGRFISRHGSKANLTIFFVVVILLGTFLPFGLMTFEFQLPANSGEDVNPTLQCTKSEGVVHCHFTDSRGYDRVVVTTGGDVVETVEDPPYDFDLQVSEIEAQRGDKRFVVELQDDEGNTLRRYRRNVELIPG